MFINKINSEDLKYIFCGMLSDKNNIKNIKFNSEKSEIIKTLEKNDLSSLQKIVNKYKEECFKTLKGIIKY